MTHSGHANNHTTVSYHINGPQSGQVKFWPGASGSYNPDGYVSVAMDGGPSNITLFFHSADQAIAWAQALTTAADMLANRPAGAFDVSVPFPAPADTRCSTCGRAAHYGPDAPGPHGHPYTAPATMGAS